MESPAHSLLIETDQVLVTGANGFIGVSVVANLLQQGCTKIRCLVRPSSVTDKLRSTISDHHSNGKVEIVTGDLTSQEDCRRITSNVSVILHLAAGFDKSFAGAFMNSALATRNLVEAFLAVGTPKRFVNVSSFAVYSNFGMRRRTVLDEKTPLEDRPQERYDAYGYGKLKQEQIVRRYGKTHNLPFVILRPGTVFGPGKKDLTGRIGIDTFGFFIHVGGSNRLPLTYVENCADAIVLAGTRPGVDGEIFNVVDDETLTSRQFLRAYKRKVKLFSVPLPYRFAYILSFFWEKYSTWSKGQLPPAFNRRRCSAEWKGNKFPNCKIKSQLGWSPKVGIKDAMDGFLSQFQTPTKKA